MKKLDEKNFRDTLMNGLLITMVWLGIIGLETSSSLDLKEYIVYITAIVGPFLLFARRKYLLVMARRRASQ